MPAVQPALLVDIDCDLYVSAIDALRWMLRSQLLVAGSLVRYDDWPAAKHYPNASAFGGETRVPINPFPPAGSHAARNLWGEALAHAQVTEEFELAWEGPLGNGDYLTPVYLLRSVGPRGRAQFFAQRANKGARNG